MGSDLLKATQLDSRELGFEPWSVWVPNSFSFHHLRSDSFILSQFRGLMVTLRSREGMCGNKLKGRHPGRHP